MEAYLFIYSRLERFDYRLIYAPSQSFLPNPTRNEFISFAREVINTDNVSNGKINTARWSLIRRGDKVLFGIGIYNKNLGDCSSDIETRNVRGFFGLVFNYEKESLPKECFAMSFFESIYSSYIMPLWHAEKKDEHKINSIIQKIDLNVEDSCTDSPIKLNTHSSVCKILPETIVVDEAINSALSVEDIEIVLGLNDIKHVTSASLSQFRNISIIGNHTEDDIPVSNKKSHVASVAHKEGRERHRDYSSTVSGQSNDKSKSVCCDYEHLADVIYSKLKRCGVNVKRVVTSLAKKCGLYIADYPMHDSVNKMHSNSDNNNALPYDVIDNSGQEITQSITDKEKAERRNRFAEIRKELSNSSNPQNNIEAGTSSKNPLNDVNDLEDLKSLSPKDKDSFDIEDLN